MLNIRPVSDSNSTDPVELALDQADFVAETNPNRMTHDEVFKGVRDKINENHMSQAMKETIIKPSL